jgi:hypothetical protein
MKGWIFFFTFLGALAVVSAISGVSQFTAELGKGTTVAMHPNILSRLVAAGEGAVFLTIAWAIYARRPWVWRLVFYLFIASWAYSVWGSYVDLARQYPAQAKSETMMFAGLVGLMFAIVGAFWGHRWYQKKTYFFPEHSNG